MAILCLHAAHILWRQLRNTVSTSNSGTPIVLVSGHVVNTVANVVAPTRHTVAMKL